MNLEVQIFEQRAHANFSLHVILLLTFIQDFLHKPILRILIHELPAMLNYNKNKSYKFLCVYIYKIIERKVYYVQSLTFNKIKLHEIYQRYFKCYFINNRIIII